MIGHQLQLGTPEQFDPERAEWALSELVAWWREGSPLPETDPMQLRREKLADELEGMFQ